MPSGHGFLRSHLGSGMPEMGFQQWNSTFCDRRKLFMQYAPTSTRPGVRIEYGSGTLSVVCKTLHWLTNQVYRDDAMLAVSRFQVAIDPAKRSTGVLDPPLKKSEAADQVRSAAFFVGFSVASAGPQKVQSVRAILGMNSQVVFNQRLAWFHCPLSSPREYLGSSPPQGAFFNPDTPKPSVTLRALSLMDDLGVADDLRSTPAAVTQGWESDELATSILAHQVMGAGFNYFVLDVAK